MPESRPASEDAAPDPHGAAQPESRAEPERLSALRMAGLGAPTATRFPGRNDPCLCGSGQKFKRCCGR